MLTRPYSFKKRIMTTIVLGIMILFSSSVVSIFGEDRFRTYDQDRERFERYIDDANSEVSREDWERIVLGGKEELEAKWQEEADLAMEEALEEEGDTEEVRQKLEQEKEEAFAEWERAIYTEMSKELGKWYVERENILYIELDHEKLKEILSDAESKTTLFDWDSMVLPVENEVTAAWEDEVGKQIEKSLLRVSDFQADDETAKYYEQEILTIEKALKEKFRLEKEGLVFDARNEFITKLQENKHDVESLRLESEKSRAKKETDIILEDVKKDLEKLESNLLTNDQNKTEEGTETDLSNMGDEWKEKIQTLINAGIERWDQAMKDLIASMKDWRANALEAYDEGDRLWREAFEKLIHARDSWREHQMGIIKESRDMWIGEDWNNFLQNPGGKLQELYENQEKAQQDLFDYMNVQEQQWMTRQEEMLQMAVEGTDTYREASSNVIWLEEMIGKI